MVQDIERIVRVVEEKNVTESKDHAGHSHRDRRQQADQRPQRGHSACLLEEICAAENQHRADERGEKRHLQAVEERRDHAAIDQPESVMAHAERLVVGPELDERGVDRHAQHREKQRADGDAEAKHGDIEGRLRLGRKGHGARGKLCLKPPLHRRIDHERNQHRNEKNQADDGAFIEVLLPDDLFEDIERQHVEVAADHLGDAKLAHRIREDNHGCADQPVFRPGQGDGEESAQRWRSQRLRRLV